MPHFLVLTILPLGLLSLLYLGSRLHNLARNYFSARQLNLPIIVLPVSWQDTLWLILAPTLSPFFSSLPLPSSLLKWVKYSIIGWQLHDRHTTHSHLGPAFVLVAPGHNEVFIAEPHAAAHVLGKYKEWIKSEELYVLFGAFGQNVNSVNGKDWQRHRKITGPTFKEGTNGVVWTQTRLRAAVLVERWTAGKEGMDLAEVATGTCRMVMDVLMAAGFGKTSSDDGVGLAEKGKGHTMSYGDALHTLLQNLAMVITLAKSGIPSWLLPTKLRHLMTALKEFKRYTTEEIELQREAIANEEPVQDNLVSELVRANYLAHEEGGGKMTLSDDELHGNMFIFSLAGFETTATALTYALPLLACHPRVQEWVAAEAREVLGAEEDGSLYEECFPKLVRTLAVMHETLRLWGSVQGLARYTGSVPQPLTIGDKIYDIPPQTYVTVNISAIHSDPDTWGANALDWHPQRWIATSPSGEEEFAGPAHENFLAWSTGPRVCPGRKFSQVEFVAAVAMILKDYRIEVVKLNDEEGESEARRRVQDVIQDSGFNFSPKMRRPETARLKLVSREG